MEAIAAPSSSAPAAVPSSGPTAKELLRAISAAAPQLWFPLRHAEQTGTPRDSLDEPLWLLRQTGMVQVGDWIGGLGQGFVLTRDGEKAADHSDPIPPAVGTPKAAPSSESVPAARPLPTVLRPAVVAPAFLLANVVWFAVGLFLAWKAGVGLEYLKGEGHPASNRVLERIGALSGSQLLSGEWWRLLTNTFVHVGLFHLFGNMLMLGILGPVSEGLWGRWRFALVYFASGLAGSCAAMALHPMADTGNGLREVLLAGASGALWGVLLSVVVWLLRYREELAAGVAQEWGRKLAFAVFLNLVLSFAPGISIEAHLGGGFAGAAMAFWLDRRFRPNRAITGVGVALLVAAMLATLYASMWYSEVWEPLRVVHSVRRMLAEVMKTPDGP